MSWPAPMPISEKLPKRLEGRPDSAEVCVWDPKASLWTIASFNYDNAESNDGAWTTITGEVAETSTFTHWVPLPPEVTA